MSYDAFEDLNAPIVIDNGSGSLKAGIAGNERPKDIVPACVGNPKHKRVILQAPKSEKYYGNKAMQYRGLCSLSYPIKHGVVTNWNEMNQLWQYVYKELMNTNPSEHPVLLTEAPLNPIKNRAKTSEIFFEQFNVPALYFAPPPVLALYASGRLTGCVLDSGHGVTSCVPICEGFALPHAVTRMDIAGSDVNEYFAHLLRESGITFHTSSEMETIRIIKEKECELQGSSDTNSSSVTSSRVGGVGKSPLVSKSKLGSSSNDDGNGIKYSLPDGSILEIGNARYKAPELLFNPSLIGMEYRGIHYCVLDSIAKADLDLRRDLYSRVVLSGGSTNIKNFGKRLVSELQANVPKARVKVYAPHERHLTTWIGGSVLSFLESFRPMWIRKNEYQESGSSILERKMFF